MAGVFSHGKPAKEPTKNDWQINEAMNSPLCTLHLLTTPRMGGFFRLHLIRSSIWQYLAVSRGYNTMEVRLFIHVERATRKGIMIWMKLGFRRRWQDPTSVNRIQQYDVRQLPNIKHSPT